MKQKRMLIIGGVVLVMLILFLQNIFPFSLLQSIGPQEPVVLNIDEAAGGPDRTQGGLRWGNLGDDIGNRCDIIENVYYFESDTDAIIEGGNFNMLKFQGRGDSQSYDFYICKTETEGVPVDPSLERNIPCVETPVFLGTFRVDQ